MEKKSTHRVEVVKLDPFKHPNADSLVIQAVYGYQVVLREDDWKGVELGAYIVPDTVVDTRRSEFSWLAPDVNPNFRKASETEPYLHRVTVMRLRGVISYGLMVPAPAGSKPGDDVSDLLGTTRYEPELTTEGQTQAPVGYTKDYDLEAFERYSDELFTFGENVILTEKLDGKNGRFCFRVNEDGEDVMHAGSRNIWLEDRPGLVWWQVVRDNPKLVEFCKEHPELTVYGEVVGFTGASKTPRYGYPEGKVGFYVFDMLRGTNWLDYDEMLSLCKAAGFLTAPEVARLPFDFSKVKELADGPSLIPGAKHKREGVVVRPLKERQELVGRAVLKVVSPKALMG